MRARSSKAPNDPRVRETRAAIVGSFNGMVLDRPFEQIQVAHVVARAGVGRSTFYEHFRNIDDLLGHAAKGVLGPLADAVGPGDATTRIAHVLEHFRANLARARAMMRGPGGDAMTRALTDLIAARIGGLGAGGCPAALPAPLAASLIAGAQLGLIREWLHAPAACGANGVARSIRKTTLAIVGALGVTGGGDGAAPGAFDPAT